MVDRADGDTERWVAGLSLAVPGVVLVTLAVLAPPAFLPAAEGTWALVLAGLAAAELARLRAEGIVGRDTPPPRHAVTVLGLAFVAPVALVAIDLVAVAVSGLLMRPRRPNRVLVEAGMGATCTAVGIGVFRLVAGDGSSLHLRTVIGLVLAGIVMAAGRMVVQVMLQAPTETEPRTEAWRVSRTTLGTVVGLAVGVAGVQVAASGAVGAWTVGVAVVGLIALTLVHADDDREALQQGHVARMQSAMLDGVMSGRVAEEAAAALVAPLRATRVGVLEPCGRHVVAVESAGEVMVGTREAAGVHALERLIEGSLLRVTRTTTADGALAELVESLDLGEDVHDVIVTTGSVGDRTTLVYAMRPAWWSEPFDLRDRSTLLQAVGEIGAAMTLSTRIASLEAQASTDVLTGLRSAASVTSAMWTAVRRPDPQPFAVLLVDINGFKEVNDTLGHQTGDVVLAEVGRRLDALARPGVLIGRQGGDEFVVVVDAQPDAQGRAAAVAEEVAEEVAAAVSAPITHGDLVLDLRVSIGIARFPEHGTDPDELRRAADVAVYDAKARGRLVTAYEGHLDRHRTRRMGLATDLRAALAAGDLRVVFQPKVAFDDGRLVGAEALVRWTHPTLGYVPPGEVISVAEHAGLLLEVTDVVLDAAGRHCAALREQGSEVVISVNLTQRDIADPALPDRIEAATTAHGLPRGAVGVEVTETTLLTKEVEAKGVLPQLAAMGIPMAIDDFGTGYSSLAHLRSFPVDEIKIDKSFVDRMVIRPGDARIVQSIVDLGHSLGMRVVAEGVETNEVWRMLAGFGTDTAQGHHVMQAMDTDTFLAWVPFWEAQGRRTAISGERGDDLVRQRQARRRQPEVVEGDG